jgi:hypothetical protein
MSDFYYDQFGKYKGVGGWLILLCIALSIGFPLKTLITIIIFYNGTSQYFNELPALNNLFYIDSLLNILLMILSIRAGIALWRIKSGAVRIAKNFLVINFGFSVISVFLPIIVGLPTDVKAVLIPDLIRGAIQSLFYSGLWYSYLNYSKRVKETYITFSIIEESKNKSLESEKSETVEEI